MSWWLSANSIIFPKPGERRINAKIITIDDWVEFKNTLRLNSTSGWPQCIAFHFRFLLLPPPPCDMLWALIKSWSSPVHYSNSIDPLYCVHGLKMRMASACGGGGGGDCGGATETLIGSNESNIL